jgi:hypothetical protein
MRVIARRGDLHRRRGSDPSLSIFARIVEAML